MQAQGAEGLDVGVGGDVLFLAVAVVLAAHDIVARQRPHRLEDAGLLAVHGGEAPVGGRLHRQQGDDLEQVVLDHVAQRAGALVEAAARADAEVLGERDLHAGDMVAVPDRLEEGIGEAEVEDVHDRLLAEKVVDPEDRRLREDGVRDGIELERRREVAAERLFDDDAGVAGEPGGAEARGSRSRTRAGGIAR